MTSPRPKSSILESYLVGELEPAAQAEVEAQIEADPELAEWVKARQAQQAAFLMEPRRRSFAQLAEEAEGAKPGPFRRRFTLALGSLAAVMATTLVVGQLQVSQVAGPFRTKGGWTVRAVVKSPGDAEPREIHPGDELRAGDRIRLRATSPASGYAAALLEDDAGRVAVAYRPEELGRLEPGPVEFPESLELDDAVGVEKIYVLFSPETLPIDALRAELEAARREGIEEIWRPGAPVQVGVVAYRKR